MGIASLHPTHCIVTWWGIFNSHRKARCIGAKAEAGSTTGSSAPKCRLLGRYVAINVNDEK